MNKNINNQSKPLLWFVGGIVFAVIMFIVIGGLILLLTKPADSPSENSTPIAESLSNNGIAETDKTTPSNDGSADSNILIDNKDETIDSSLDTAEPNDSTVDNGVTADSDSVSSNIDTIDSDYTTTDSSNVNTDSAGEKNTIVWITDSGSKYHSKPSCSNMKSPKEITLEEAQKEGYEPCKRCH